MATTRRERCVPLFRERTECAVALARPHGYRQVTREERHRGGSGLSSGKRCWRFLAETVRQPDGSRTADVRVHECKSSREVANAHGVSGRAGVLPSYLGGMLRLCPGFN